ncbi:MAG: hypothetical protein DME25_21040 [Verrucomicrobia bacterium]|nr:MAG: hypothetical protein DME25_21040 [Verrucomicrobiota bacterium]
MKMRFRDLWRWDGEISRSTYLIWAAVLFAIKYNFDRLLLRAVFHEEWSVFNYFDRATPWLSFTPRQRPAEYLVLLAAALPFLWAGIMLCLKRLRSARLPLWLAVLFVIPVLKWFLFLVLGLVPHREAAAAAKESATGPVDWLLRWYPKSAGGSAAVAVLLSALQAPIATLIGTQLLGDYGWALFVGVPFCMGFSAVLLHGARQRRTLGESLSVALLSIALAGAVLLAVAFEGLICIIMAAPLALVLAALGGLAAHAVQAAAWGVVPPRLHCIPFLALPLMLTAEHVSHEPPPLLKVTTVIEVNAPPNQVWENLVSFAELPPPTETLFKLGIAYPIHARIQGRGTGAVRHCVFSTGAFVEPIVVWDQPRLLQFSVTSNPAPMEEWTPYRHIHPRHLDGFLVSRQGQFLLTGLPNGRTRLEGTTWYHHTMWPAAYWQLWSDHIIHTIHRRVLLHVKNLSEQAQSKANSL